MLIDSIIISYYCFYRCYHCHRCVSIIINMLAFGSTSLLSCRHADHEALQPAAGFQPRQYPKPDGKVSFDMTTSLHRSGTNHEHDQPSHLKLKNKGVPTVVNLPIYAGPESRYCPAGMSIDVIPPAAEWILLLLSIQEAACELSCIGIQFNARGKERERVNCQSWYIRFIL